MAAFFDILFSLLYETDSKIYFFIVCAVNVVLAK